MMSYQVFGIFAHDHWENVLLKATFWRVIVMATVDEHIIFSTMSVQITVHHYFSFFHKFFDHFSRMPNARKSLFQNRLVVTIQITSSQRASVIADYNAGRIEHRHNFKNERVS